MGDTLLVQISLFFFPQELRSSDLHEVMAATEDEIIEMSSQAESARQRLLEKRAALQLASAELLKPKKEVRDEILARLDAWTTKNKTEEQKAENWRELEDLRNKSLKMVNDVLMTGADIFGSVMEVVNLMAEVNYYDTASLSAQVAKLEQERDERANQAKEVEESLRFQLHEEMMKCRCLHSQVAMLEQEKPGKDLPFHKFV